MAPRTKRHSIIITFFVLLLLLSFVHADPDNSTSSSSSRDTKSSTSATSSSSSSGSSPSQSSNSTPASCQNSNCPAPCSKSPCQSGEQCILGVLASCGSCPPSWCSSGQPTYSGGSNSTSSSSSSGGNSDMVGGLVGGMVAVLVLAVGGYAGMRYRKRSKEGLPFFGGKKPTNDAMLHESWSGMNVGSGLNISRQSAVIPIAYYPPGSTSSIVVTNPTGNQETLVPPRPAFARQGAAQGEGDRTSVRSENPFDDLDDEDAVEVKRAVVTKPLRTVPRGPGLTSQSTLQTNDNADRPMSSIPDQDSEYMNPTHSMIIDRLSPEAPGGDRDSVASSVIISSGVAKVTTPATGPGPVGSQPSTVKPTLVRVNTLTRSNSNASRLPPIAGSSASSTPMASTASLAHSSTPLVPSRFNPNKSAPNVNLPNLTIHNASTSTISTAESPFSDRHSITEYDDDDDRGARYSGASQLASRPETALLSPSDSYAPHRIGIDSMASNSNSLYGSDGEITIFWSENDPRRSEYEAANGRRLDPRDTLATERVISFAESDASSRVRDTMATEGAGRVISLFGEEEEEDR